MTLKVSSADKVLFPAIDGTKGLLVSYYERLADALFPAVAGRPLTLQRFPRGIDAPGFMQKNAADHFPDSIDRYEVPKQEGGTTLYPVATLPENLPWLANQNTIAFHIWTATVEHPDNPDWLILDLDPAADDQVDQVREVAAATRSVLARFDLEALLVATGSSGYHLWVPVDTSAGLDHDQVSLASRALAGMVARAEPDLATTEFLKKERKGRVFVDWLRSRRGATVVAPLSVRAKPRASVATPISWEELPLVAPDRFTITDVDNLLDRPVPQVAAERRFALPVDSIVEQARSEGVDLDTPFDRFGRR